MARSPHAESDLASQLLEKNFVAPAHVEQSPQQSPAASRPETENWVPITHALQMPAAPSNVSEPGSKPITAPAVQQVVFALQTASVVAVPSLATYSLVASQIFQGLQQLASSVPEEVNFPVPHTAHVPARPVVVREPAVYPTTPAFGEAAQHVALFPHAEVDVVVHAAV